MKRCLIMLLALLLLLTGCSTRQSVDPPKTEPVEAEEMVTKTFQLLLSESTHYPDGRKLRSEFEYDNYEDANPDSVLFFENNEQRQLRYKSDKTDSRGRLSLKKWCWKN